MKHPCQNMIWASISLSPSRQAGAWEDTIRHARTRNNTRSIHTCNKAYTTTSTHTRTCQTALHSDHAQRTRAPPRCDLHGVRPVCEEIAHDVSASAMDFIKWVKIWLKWNRWNIGKRQITFWWFPNRVVEIASARKQSPPHFIWSLVLCLWFAS